MPGLCVQQVDTDEPVFTMTGHLFLLWASPVCSHIALESTLPLNTFPNHQQPITAFPIGLTDDTVKHTHDYTPSWFKLPSKVHQTHKTVLVRFSVCLVQNVFIKPSVCLNHFKWVVIKVEASVTKLSSPLFYREAEINPSHCSTLWRLCLNSS